MSSGFVSGGTAEEPTERDDEWRRAQQELEEDRRRKNELSKQDGGESLFDVLQRNKMAKQEAFEESIRLKNQFRALDEDEVEFLDSLLESTRAQEAAVKKETAENLAEYQRQREEAERALIEGTSGGQHSSTSGVSVPGEEEQWVVAGKKRKRNKKEAFVPPKIRKSSSATEDAPAPAGQKSLSKTTASSEESTNRAKIKPDRHSSSAPAPAKIVSMETNNKSSDVKFTKIEPQHKATPNTSLGLVAYGSDEDSD